MCDWTGPFDIYNASAISSTANPDASHPYIEFTAKYPRNTPYTPNVVATDTGSMIPVTFRASDKVKAQNTAYALANDPSAQITMSINFAYVRAHGDPEDKTLWAPTLDQAAYPSITASPTDPWGIDPAGVYTGVPDTPAPCPSLYDDSQAPNGQGDNPLSQSTTLLLPLVIAIPAVLICCSVAYVIGYRMSRGRQLTVELAVEEMPPAYTSQQRPTLYMVSNPLNTESETSKPRHPSPPRRQPSPPRRGLPPGWETFYDPIDGKPYYHNASTGQTVWEAPTF